MLSLHAVLLATGLFALTFMSPGPNLLVVVQASLSQGRASGIAAGLGVATGDAIYAALGLAGMAALIAAGGVMFSAIKLLGGAYLVWYGWKLLRGGRPQVDLDDTARAPVLPVSNAALYRRGLLTCLANPQTVLFFASIFSVTLTPDTSWVTKLATWVGIVLTSLLWRAVVSQAFSLAPVRSVYLRFRGVLERVVGVALAGFGIRLIHQGLTRH